LDDLKVLIRFEVDACLPPANKTADLDDLTASLEGLNITKKAAAVKDDTDILPLVKVVSNGTLVPQDRLVELTTRSQKSFETFNWADPYTQLYFSQTPHIYVAVHRNGSFQSIHKKQLGEGDLKDIHTDQEKNLRRLRVLLGIIVNKVKEAGADKQMALLCRRGDLKLHENLDSRSCLPDDHLALFTMPSSGVKGK
jgi:hypothetical protein